MSSRRTVSMTLSWIAGICACAYTHAAAAQADRATSRPNILLIIADDVGLDVTTDLYPGLIDELADQYGPAGHAHPDHEKIVGNPASTPVLEDLARGGVVFSNAWAEPFCSPTRASILTGLFAARTDVLTPADPLSQNHVSVAQLLKDDGGYSTAVFGKWHMAGVPRGDVEYPGMKPLEAGFDLFKGNLHAALQTFWEYDYHVQDEDTAPGEWRTEAPPERSLPGIAPTTYAPVVKGADTIEWITQREEEDPDKPWFVWLAFNLSHATISRTPSQMIVPNEDTLNDAARAEMDACGGEFGSANLGSCSGEQVMRAMTSSMDTIIGKVLEAVDELDPNTYVIFIGDNGTPMYGRPGLDFIDNMYITRSGRGKATVYESGARVPLVIRGPGIEAGSRNDEFVHATDLFATILELADLPVPQAVPSRDGAATVSVDSVSLAPVLFGDETVVRDPNEGYLLTEVRGRRSQVGARNSAYKVVCRGSAEVADCDLYDLAADPLEEYPLEKPDDCGPYRDGTWTPDDSAWHYCRLTEIVATESFFQG